MGSKIACFEGNMSDMTEKFGEQREDTEAEEDKSKVQEESRLNRIRKRKMEVKLEAGGGEGF
jgi:hypothetical protein